MVELWAQLMNFFNLYGLWIAIGSVAMFVISLAAMPIIIARIPEDYFTHAGRSRMGETWRHPLLRLLSLCFRNMLGLIMVVAGFIMLFTPGQGLLSMLFGLMIMNYPGKYKLECRIVQRPLIFNAINSIRRKKGLSPLQQPELDGCS